MDPHKIEEIRRANFPAARRGYDRDAVDDFLDRLASSLEADAEAAPAEPGGAVKREIARVGERTAGILAAAEEAAGNVRDEADKRGAEAKEAAEEITRKARIEASEKSTKLVADAEKKAEQMIDEAVARRRRLNQAITSLAERRDEIAAETTRLATELNAAVGRLTEFDEPADVGASAPGGSAVGDEPHPPEAQAAVPSAEQATSGPAKTPPKPDDSADQGTPDGFEEDDGGEYAAESDAYDVLEDDEPRTPGEVRLLVDPDEDEQELIAPSRARSGPEPTEESPLPPADEDDDDEDDDDAFERGAASEDATTVQKPAPPSAGDPRYRKP